MSISSHNKDLEHACSAQPQPWPGSCRNCAGRIETGMDFGRQPVCHHFGKKPEAVPLYPLAIGQCTDCGLVQLTKGPTPSQLQPTLNWLTYNEPERHLDDLTEVLSRLPGLSPTSRILGITYKEETLLRRLEARGFARCSRLRPAEDLGVDDECAGLETLQLGLTPDFGLKWSAEHGPADLVIVRHLFEHLFWQKSFLDFVHNVMAKNAYIVVEVPDCKRSLELNDYTMIWEEHLVYYTENTFSKALDHYGFTLVQLINYPLAMENSLVGIWSKDSVLSAKATGDVVAEHRRFGDYCQNFSREKHKIANLLRAEKDRGGKIGLLGAGHLATTFLNLFEIADCIDVVFDDNPNKLSLSMPMVPAKIVPSSELLGSDSTEICLLAVNPENEAGILQKNKVYLDRGGKFASIFPASQMGLRDTFV